MSLISIVIPCYNEEESIPCFIDEFNKIKALMPDAKFELIFVDDGSSDKTLEVLRKTDGIRYISFSRNFGKEAAMYAGLKAAKGDYAAIMDADLQDPPSLLPEMYKAVTEEGYDCAAAIRSSRKGEPKIRSFLAKIYYKILNGISDTKIKDGARDFRLMSRQMVDAILSMTEYNRFTKGLFSWVGFSTKWLTYEHINRVAGKTTWNFWGLFMYSIDGILAFSVKPLALASFFGFFFCLLAFLGIAFIIIRWLLFGDPVAGWASTVTIVLFVGGIQLFCTGILGQYLAKSYLETKQRPVFIVKEESKESRVLYEEH